MRTKAELRGVRIHDLRHTFASLLVSGGMTLPMIGKLLGHTQVQTTQRYAHLLDDPLRAGLEQVGCAIAGVDREQVRAYADRLAGLSGTIGLVGVIVYQVLVIHHVDAIIVGILLTMIVTKSLAHLYAERHL